MPFVTLKNGSSSTDVVINTKNVLPGEYNLVLESFDSAYNTLVLMTDTIKIVISPPLAPLPAPLPAP